MWITVREDLSANTWQPISLIVVTKWPVLVMARGAESGKRWLGGEDWINGDIHASTCRLWAGGLACPN